MRALLGIGLAIGAGLLGIDHLTEQMSLGGSFSSRNPLLAEARVAAPPPAKTIVYQTAAAETSPLPQVQAAPGAPRAQPIEPIVAPVARTKPVMPKVVVTKPAASKVAPKAAPKAATAKPGTAKAGTPKTGKTKVGAAKSKVASKPMPAKPAVTVMRPGVIVPGGSGFKLSCTAAQKLNAGRQRCVPLKSQAVGSVKAV